MGQQQNAFAARRIFLRVFTQRTEAFAQNEFARAHHIRAALTEIRAAPLSRGGERHRRRSFPVRSAGKVCFHRVVRRVVVRQNLHKRLQRSRHVLFGVARQRVQLVHLHRAFGDCTCFV